MNPFHVYTYPFYTRELNKTWVFNNMFFDSFSTIDQISEFEFQTNKYTNSIHVYPAHITVAE
ncbi:hypothetical protein D3C85_1666910 [compost metagenome]